MPVEPTFELVPWRAPGHELVEVCHSLTPVDEPKAWRRVPEHLVALVLCTVRVEAPLFDQFVQNLSRLRVNRREEHCL